MNFLKAAVGTVKQPAAQAGALDLSDPKVLFERKRAGMLKLIAKQDRYREQRRFYTKDDKQDIMRYV
jgi:hypothetical protein